MIPLQPLFLSHIAFFIQHFSPLFLSSFSLLLRFLHLNSILSFFSAQPVPQYAMSTCIFPKYRQFIEQNIDTRVERQLVVHFIKVILRSRCYFYVLLLLLLTWLYTALAPTHYFDCAGVDAPKYRYR